MTAGGWGHSSKTKVWGEAGDRQGSLQPMMGLYFGVFSVWFTELEVKGVGPRSLGSTVTPKAPQLRELLRVGAQPMQRPLSHAA